MCVMCAVCVRRGCVRLCACVVVSVYACLVYACVLCGVQGVCTVCCVHGGTSNANNKGVE